LKTLKNIWTEEDDMDILQAVKERRSIREFQKKEIPVPLGYPARIPKAPRRVSREEAVEFRWPSPFIHTNIITGMNRIGNRTLRTSRFSLHGSSNS
jgi:hypothetical protein